MKQSPYINKLYKFLLISFFFHFLIFLDCTSRTEYIKTFYQSLNLDLLPWGISPSELKKQYKEYIIKETEQFLELGIKAEVKDQKQIPVLNELEPPLIFRLICDYNNNQCVIFRIEKIGTEKEIENYYNDFIKNNNIKEIDLKKEKSNEYITDAGNTIKEKYKLFETKDYIIEVYLTNMIFPEDIKDSKEIVLEENSDIDIRIYSKKYNPYINLDFFINN